MSITLTVLASSSEANCCLIRSATTTLMVDCGLPRTKCIRALAAIGVNAESIAAVCCTHSHGDHASGLDGFAGRLGIPVYCSPGEAVFLKASGCSAKLMAFDAEPKGFRSFMVGDIEVTPYSIPHESPDPVCFRFADHERVITYATDLGWIPPDIEQELLNANLMLIESNYDIDMLKASAYPRATKVRTASPVGHLDNEATCDMLSRINGRPNIVVLAHVSTTANDGELALLLAHKAVANKGIRVVLATDVIGVAL